MSDDDILVGLEQIAKAYGISRHTAGQMVRAGHIPAKRVGRKWLLSTIVRDRWLGVAYDEAKAQGKMRRIVIGVEPGQFHVMDVVKIGDDLDKEAARALGADGPALRPRDDGVYVYEQGAP